MAERGRVAFNYQPFRDHYVVYSVLYPYNKNKSLLQWGSIKTLTVGETARLPIAGNRRQRVNFFDVCFLSIYERHASFLADSVCLCDPSCIPGVGGGEQELLSKHFRNSSR